MGSCKKDFPATNQKVNGQPLIYLDSAASALKADVVTERLNNYYRYESSNVHRGAHSLSAQSTEDFEKARVKVAEFLNAPSSEIVFSTGATGALNLISQSLTSSILNEGDEIIVTEMEHHANFVPWQYLAKKHGLVFKVAKVNPETLDLNYDHFADLLTERTKVIALSHYSNVTGVQINLSKIHELTQGKEIIKVLDSAQSASVLDLDVKS